MCFSQPKVKTPEAPPVPSEEAEAAKSRRAAEQEAGRQAQGRASTIITTPLGAQDYGDEQSRRRTTIGGF